MVNRMNYHLATSVTCLNETTTKKDLMDNLEKNLAKAKSEKYDRVIVYYSGHGDRETGGWVTYKPESAGLNGARI